MSQNEPYVMQRMKNFQPFSKHSTFYPIHSPIWPMEISTGEIQEARVRCRTTCNTFLYLELENLPSCVYRVLRSASFCWEIRLTEWKFHHLDARRRTEASTTPKYLTFEAYNDGVRRTRQTLSTLSKKLLKQHLAVNLWKHALLREEIIYPGWEKEEKVGVQALLHAFSRTKKNGWW